MSQKVIH